MFFKVMVLMFSKSIPIRSLLKISNPDDIENDRYMLHPHAKTLINRFDNYRHMARNIAGRFLLLGIFYVSGPSSAEGRYIRPPVYMIMMHPKYEKDSQGPMVGKNSGPSSCIAVAFHGFLV
jgi:hypothetical protein